MELTKLRPPIGRIGGKSRIAKQLISAFPSPETYNIFVEPFVGAGNIFYRKPKYPHQLEVLNDLDTDMITILKGIQSHGKEIDKNIKREHLTREQFHSIKDKHDPISLILKYKNSFFATGKTYLLSHQTSYMTANFIKLQERLQGVRLYNIDFESIIDKYNTPNTFFYLDPPYENPKQNDYKDYVKPEEVYNAVRKIKGKFMLSYNDSPNIRHIFRNYKIRIINTFYSQTQNKTNENKKELVITNY